MKKRRAEAAAGLDDDAERTLHPSFCAAANAISQLYTQVLTQHNIAFHAGQRHSLEKLWEWMQEQHHQFGSLPTIFDVLNFAKNELDNISQTEVVVSRSQSASPPPENYQIVSPVSCERAESQME